MDSTSSVPPTERTLAYVADSAYAGFPNWESGRPQWAFDRIAAAGRSFMTVLDSAMSHIFDEAEHERFVEGLGAVVPRGESAVRTHVSPLPNGLEVQPVLIELVEILMRVTLDASPAVDSRLRLRGSGGRPTIGADFAVQTRRHAVERPDSRRVSRGDRLGRVVRRGGPLVDTGRGRVSRLLSVPSVEWGERWEPWLVRNRHRQW